MFIVESDPTLNKDYLILSYLRMMMMRVMMMMMVMMMMRRRRRGRRLLTMPLWVNIVILHAKLDFDLTDMVQLIWVKSILDSYSLSVLCRTITSSHWQCTFNSKIQCISKFLVGTMIAFGDTYKRHSASMSLHLALYRLHFSDGKKRYIYIWCHYPTLIWHR